MTPVLIGRWQTRILMLATIGSLVALLLSLIFGFANLPVFFFVLGYVALFGVVWDIGYNALTNLRWDRDWPAAFQVAAGVWEGLVLYLVITIVGLPGIPAGLVPLWLFVLQYGLTWLLVFIWVQGPQRVFQPLWRFHGGRVFPAVSAGQRGRR